MDEEGLMFFDHESYTRRFSENFELTDIFFSWGDNEKALLSKYPNYEKNNPSGQSKNRHYKKTNQ